MNIFGEIKGNFEKEGVYLLADGEVVDSFDPGQSDCAKETVLDWAHTIGKTFAEKVGRETYKQVVVVTADKEKHLFVLCE